MAEQRSRSGSRGTGDGGVVGAVTRLLEKHPEELATGPLAAIALQLAEQLDGPNSATSKALCAKALQECLASLEVLAPAEKPKDGIDDLNERRRRKSRASG
jgi:hypothetical protein